MPKLSKEEVEYIAKLSKLELTEDEKSLYQEQLSSVIEYVDKLSEVNTDETPITANVTGLTNCYRVDNINPSNITHEDLAKNAPKFEGGSDGGSSGGSFVVPGVFE